MKKQKKHSPLVRFYLAGNSSRTVAERFGCSYYHVLRQVREEAGDAAVRKKGPVEGSFIGPRNKKYIKDVLTKRAKNKTYAEIARSYGVSYQAIMGIVKYWQGRQKEWQ